VLRQSLVARSDAFVVGIEGIGHAKPVLLPVVLDGMLGIEPVPGNEVAVFNRPICPAA
jgi:hypothetical protein